MLLLSLQLLLQLLLPVPPGALSHCGVCHPDVGHGVLSQACVDYRPGCTLLATAASVTASLLLLLLLLLHVCYNLVLPLSACQPIWQRGGATHRRTATALKPSFTRSRSASCVSERHSDLCCGGEGTEPGCCAPA